MTLQACSRNNLFCEGCFFLFEPAECFQYLLVPGPFWFKSRRHFTDKIPDIIEVYKLYGSTMMPGFEFAITPKAIDEPEVKIKTLLIAADNSKAICPGFECRLPGIVSFAKDIKYMRIDRGCRVVAADLR